MDTGLLTQTAQDIAEEVRHARTKFPSNKHNLAALVEEVGELAQALIEHDFLENPAEHPNKLQIYTEAIYKEAIQVACMAIRVAEEGDPSFFYSGVEGGYSDV